MSAYRLIAPIQAITISDGRRRVLEVAAGEVIEIPDDVPQSGLIEVMYRGTNIDVFSQDVFRRAEVIECGVSGKRIPCDG